MEYSFAKIELGYQFVSGQGKGMSSVVMSKATGETHFSSDCYDVEGEFPDFPSSDEYFFIPHEKDLDLGRNLVRRFVNEEMPSLADEVWEVFSHKGAYARFKDLLHGQGLLDAWYKFENNETDKALRQWCSENDITLEEIAPKPAS